MLLGSIPKSFITGMIEHIMKLVDLPMLLGTTIGIIFIVFVTTVRIIATIRVVIISSQMGFLGCRHQ